MRHPRSKSLLVSIFAALGGVVLASSPRVVAGPPATAPAPVVSLDDGAQGLSWSYEASYQFYTSVSPAFIWVGDSYRNPLRYRLFTQTISVRLPISRVVGRSFWRGQFEFSAGVVGSIIIHGPESYYVGIGPGFRYNFLPAGSHWSPFAELRGFVGFTDSSGIKQGQQQDLTFCYQLAFGTTYRINRKLSIQVAVVDQHISNAYLTRPNYGFDVLGINLGIHRTF